MKRKVLIGLLSIFVFVCLVNIPLSNNTAYAYDYDDDYDYYTYEDCGSYHVYWHEPEEYEEYEGEYKIIKRAGGHTYKLVSEECVYYKNGKHRYVKTYKCKYCEHKKTTKSKGYKCTYKLVSEECVYKNGKHYYIKDYSWCGYCGHEKTTKSKGYKCTYKLVSEEYVYYKNGKHRYVKTYKCKYCEHKKIVKCKFHKPTYKVVSIKYSYKGYGKHHVTKTYKCKYCKYSYNKSTSKKCIFYKKNIGNFNKAYNYCNNNGLIFDIERQLPYGEFYVWRCKKCHYEY